MGRKIVAIFLIYICTATAWFVLGATLLERTYRQDHKLKGAVGQLWGTVQTQKVPTAYYRTARVTETEREESGKTVKQRKVEPVLNYIPLASSKVNVDFSLEHRRKGLLWYSTYVVAFSGDYTLSNESNEARDTHFDFEFPALGAIYDDFQFKIDGRPIENADISSGRAGYTVRIEPGTCKTFSISYTSQGQDQWWYDFGADVSKVRNFSLSMNTDFRKVDFPENSISPTRRSSTKNGWSLSWEYASLLTGVKIGIEMPKRLNPGPWASRVTFAAPVSLFLFFFLVFIVTTLKGINLHPMNYFFVAAAFFAFHLLLAYLVDHISIHFAFIICSVVSILLVTTYMRLVVGKRFAFVEVGISQFVYLLVFSYTFFFEGFTGLAITILCILTLFVVMQLTGKVDWDAIFRKEKTARGQ